MKIRIEKNTEVNKGMMVVEKDRGITMLHPSSNETLVYPTGFDIDNYDDFILPSVTSEDWTKCMKYHNLIKKKIHDDDLFYSINGSRLDDVRNEEIEVADSVRVFHSKIKLFIKDFYIIADAQALADRRFIIDYENSVKINGGDAMHVMDILQHYSLAYHNYLYVINDMDLVLELGEFRRSSISLEKGLLIPREEYMAKVDDYISRICTINLRDWFIQNLK